MKNRKKYDYDLTKAKQIMQFIFNKDIDVSQKFEFENKIMDKIKELKKDKESYENFNISLFVNDNKVIKWKQSEWFTKVYNEEIKYIKTEYGLSKGERNLLNSLPPFLLWQNNLLVDDIDYQPVNQQQLAKCLDIDRTTVYRNMKGLVDKKIILPIRYKNEVYYLMNPHVMYAGSEINKSLIELFKLIGYVDRKHNKNNNK